MLILNPFYTPLLMQSHDDIYTRQLDREKRAREEAERLLEQKSRELYKQAKERNRALTALADSEERYRLIVELSPDAIVIESKGKIVFVNHTARLLFKESQSRTLKGLSVLDITAPQNRAQATEVIKLSYRALIHDKPMNLLCVLMVRYSRCQSGVPL